MKVFELILDILKHGNSDKEVEVVVFERDSDGCVISKKIYPVSSVFSHREPAQIYVEESNSKCIKYGS